ncbi:alpha/beta fold hydrolase [Roseomonas sp. BN140053]|uniref:alpha/beta fold hydrolase n=1 Tax=Roseomonas sp. BN140053 TaxID=3391898 RepID=UPI0039ED7A8D
MADHQVAGRDGSLFARSWCPDGRSLGADPVLVLGHDSLGCVELWRDFPGRLATALGLPVVAYDRLGFGRSDPHPGTLPLDFMRDETAAGLRPLCAGLGIARAIPFGHSAVGAMSVGLAAQQPELCVAVVTEAAQVFVEDRTLDGIRAAEVAFRDPGQFGRLVRYHGDKARWVLDAWTRTWLSPRFAPWNAEAELRRVRCPVLAIHGDNDEYGSTRHPERIAALVSGPARQLLLEGCSHVPHREQPEVVLRGLAGFLAPLLPIG